MTPIKSYDKLKNVDMVIIIVDIDELRVIAAEAMCNKDYSLALQMLEKITDLDVCDFDAYHKKGVAYLLINKLIDAEIALIKANAIQPHNANINNNLGVLYERKQAYELSIHHYERAIEINPEATDYLVNLAHTHKLRNDSSSAIKCYLRALNIDANNIQILSSLGLLYRSCNRNTDALETFEKVLAIERNNYIAI